jgi:hypothetical protein
VFRVRPGRSGEWDFRKKVRYLTGGFSPLLKDTTVFRSAAAMAVLEKAFFKKRVAFCGLEDFQYCDFHRRFGKHIAFVPTLESPD